MANMERESEKCYLLRYISFSWFKLHITSVTMVDFDIDDKKNEIYFYPNSQGPLKNAMLVCN